MYPTFEDLAKVIDHSLLHPTMTDARVRAGCELSRKYGVATACVKPYSVPMAAEIFAGSDVLVCAVAGFPHGNKHTGIKVAESVRATEEGAKEIDIVVNNGKVLGGDFAVVRAEVAEINAACVSRGAVLKVIFENDYLGKDQIKRLCELCSEIGVAFVKTGTGYAFVKKPNGDYNYVGPPRRTARSCAPTAPRPSRSKPPAACEPSTTRSTCDPGARAESAQRPPKPSPAKPSNAATDPSRNSWSNPPPARQAGGTKPRFTTETRRGRRSTEKSDLITENTDEHGEQQRARLRGANGGVTELSSGPDPISQSLLFSVFICGSPHLFLHVPPSPPSFRGKPEPTP